MVGPAKKPILAQPQKPIDKLGFPSGSRPNQPQTIKKNNQPADTFELKFETQFVQFLGQTGLKNSQQVIAFLKSPAGTSIKALVHEQVAVFASLKQTQQQDARDALVRKIRVMAFLYLMAVYKKKAHAKELNAAIQKQIDKLLSQNQPNNAAETHSFELAHPNSFILRQSSIAYQLTLSMLNSTVAEKQKAMQQIDNEIAALYVESDNILQRFAMFNRQFDHFAKEYDLFATRTSSLSSAEKIVAIKQMMDDLSDMISAKHTETAHLIESKQQQQSSKLLFEIHGLDMHFSGLKDILAELENRKSFYDEKGLKVSSYKMAAFVVPNSQRLYVDPQTGKGYLLSATADFQAENLQSLFNSLSPSDKLLAQQNFEHAKPQIAHPRDVAANQQQLELKMHHEKLAKALMHKEQLQQEIIALENQISRVSSFRAQIDTMGINANNDQLPQPRLSLTPAPSLQNSSLKKESVAKKQLHQELVDLSHSKPTQAAIDLFAARFTLADGTPNRKAQDLIKASITPGMPIPEVAMNSLLRNLPHPSNAPRVSPISDKTPTKVTAPTPFNMKPFGG